MWIFIGFLLILIRGFFLEWLNKVLIKEDFLILFWLINDICKEILF